MIRRIAGAAETRFALCALALSAGHLWLWGTLYIGPTPSLLACEWTLSALVGACYSAWFIRDTLLDAEFQLRSGANGPSQDAADVLVILACICITAHAIFLALGLPSFFQPHVGATVVAGWRIFGIVLTMASQSILYLLWLVGRNRNRLLARSRTLTKRKG